MSPVKIALLGVGRWGVHLLRNFLAHPQAELVAVVDPDADRLHVVSDRFNLNAAVSQSTDWQWAIQHLDVEAVAIATPASLHEDMIRAALLQGHHVLAEKPLTLEAETAIALCELADQQQRQLIVDHTYLFHPAVQQAQHVK
ncbi:MAG: Gfo/Idh/MocA family oxidoreductase [Microcoleus sp. SIO2G3]|nr:Gfo/Idh/MocA family oxidoreductase [Microcoleus sp. SIO2G3]